MKYIYFEGHFVKGGLYENVQYTAAADDDATAELVHACVTVLV